MDDRFAEGFERMLAETPEGPSWEQVSTHTAAPQAPSPSWRRRVLVGIGAFALTVVVIGAVALAMRPESGSVVITADTSTTSTAPAVLNDRERTGVTAWTEQLGIAQDDEGVWRERYDAMCTEGVWDTDVALRLSAEYINEDLTAGLSVRAPELGDPTVEEGATALWMMGAQACGELFPEDARAAGPPFIGNEEPTAPTLNTVCGPIALGDGTSPEFPSKPLTADALAALATTDELGLEGEFFDGIEWVIADDSNPDRLLLFGTGPTDEEGNPVYAHALFEKRDGVWGAAGWGGCHIEVTAAGWGTADWVLDPDAPFDPESAELGVLIQERACANGEAPDGRDITSVSVAEPDRVVLHVFVAPLPGMATCPGNPWHPLTVSLTEPLNSRDLYDGREVPPVLVWSDDGTMVGPNDR